MNVEPVSSRRRATHAETASVAGDLKTLPLPGVEKRLASPPEGISRAEAGTRLAAYGRNELVERKPSTLLTLLGYVWGPIPWMIDVAVVLSAVLGHWADFVTIVVLLLANAGVGFWEEHQAGKKIDALKAQLAVKALVRREKGRG